MHCFVYIRHQFVYNTDHTSFSKCSIQHIVGHHRPVETTEMSPFVYEIGAYVTKNELEQSFWSDGMQNPTVP